MRARCEPDKLRTVVRYCPRTHPACAVKPLRLPGVVLRVTATAAGRSVLAQTATAPHGHAQERPNGLPTRWTVFTEGGVQKTLRPHLRVPHRVLNGTESWNGPALSPDGTTIAATSGRTLELWDTATMQRRSSIQLAAPGGGAEVAAFTPDGQQLLLRRNTYAEVIDVATGRRVTTLDVKPGAMAFSSAGDLAAIAAGSDGRVTVWSTHDWRRLPVEPEPLDDGVTAVSFSPDSTEVLATTTSDIVLLDITEASPTPLRFNATRFWDAAFLSPDQILAWSGFGMNALPHTWQVDMDGGVRRACEIAGRELTRAEWRRVLPDRDQQPACTE